MPSWPHKCESRTCFIEMDRFRESWSGLDYFESSIRITPDDPSEQSVVRDAPVLLLLLVFLYVSLWLRKSRGTFPDASEENISASREDYIILIGKHLLHELAWRCQMQPWDVKYQHWHKFRCQRARSFIQVARRQVRSYNSPLVKWHPMRSRLARMRVNTPLCSARETAPTVPGSRH